MPIDEIINADAPVKPAAKFSRPREGEVARIDSDGRALVRLDGASSVLGPCRGNLSVEKGDRVLVAFPGRGAERPWIVAVDQ